VTIGLDLDISTLNLTLLLLYYTSRLLYFEEIRVKWQDKVCSLCYWRMFMFGRDICSSHTIKILWKEKGNCEK